LTAGAFLTKQELIIGVTQRAVGKYKGHLIQPFPDRVAAVVRLIYKVNPDLNITCVPLNDVAGPAGVLPRIDLLLLTEETVAGGDKVNAIRKSRGLEEVHYAPLRLITTGGLVRISSSGLRELDEPDKP
jgi:phosphopantetheine adenylyltransferase/dephospho-CoA kinase